MGIPGSSRSLIPKFSVFPHGNEPERSKSSHTLFLGKAEQRLRFLLHTEIQIIQVLHSSRENSQSVDQGSELEFLGEEQGSQGFVPALGICRKMRKEKWDGEVGVEWEQSRQWPKNVGAGREKCWESQSRGDLSFLQPMEQKSWESPSLEVPEARLDGNWSSLG